MLKKPIFSLRAVEQLVNNNVAQADKHRFAFPYAPYAINPDVFRISLEENRGEKDRADVPEGTSDEEDGEIKFESISDTGEYGPPPIFPPVAPCQTRILPAARMDPQYADCWPIGFSKEDWHTVWAGRTFRINDYLQTLRLLYQTSVTTAIRETNY
jgi:hypothetical protein